MPHQKKIWFGITHPSPHKKNLALPLSPLPAKQLDYEIKKKLPSVVEIVQISLCGE